MAAEQEPKLPFQIGAADSGARLDLVHQLFDLPVGRVERFELLLQLVEFLARILPGVLGRDAEGELVADVPRFVVEGGEHRPVEQVVGIVTVIQKPRQLDLA